MGLPARRVQLRRAGARALHRRLPGRNLSRRASCRAAWAGRGGARLRHVEAPHVSPDHLSDRAQARASGLFDRDDFDGEVDGAGLARHSMGRDEHCVEDPQRHARHLSAAHPCRRDLFRRQLHHRRWLPCARAAPVAASAGPGQAEGSAHARRDPRAHRRQDAQELRPARSAAGRVADRQRRRCDLDPGLLRLGQEHVSALHQSARDAGPGRGDGRGRDHQNAPARATGGPSPRTGARSTASAPNSPWCSRASTCGRI